MTVVAEEDASHAIWPSCPARGWAAGVEKLTARPVPGAELVPHLLSERTLETHGPCTSVTFSTTLRPAVSAASGLSYNAFRDHANESLRVSAGEHLTNILLRAGCCTISWT